MSEKKIVGVMRVRRKIGNNFKIEIIEKKYLKKSHFLSQKLIFHCLKKNPKKVDFFYYFRLHERLELLEHTRTLRTLKTE